MNEVKPGETESAVDPDPTGDMWLVDEVIKTATTKLLAEPAFKEVETLENFKKLCEGTDGYTDTKDYGNDTYAIGGKHSGTTVIIEGGEYWNEQSEQFSHIRDLFAQVASYRPKDLTGAWLVLRNT